MVGVLVLSCISEATAQACDDNEPATGADMLGIDVNACDGTADAATCNHTCAPGYEAGSITCAAGIGATDGTYTVVSCSAIECTQPASIVGYTVGEAQLDVSLGFAVTATCDSGFAGASPQAVACSTAGDYVLTGCASCAAGQYAPTQAATCTPCIAGQYSAEASQNCTDCASGQADLDSDPSTACEVCAPGQHSAAASQNCSDCASGQADLDSDPSTACQ
eukprot:COSAG02_NODE_8538_length_2532_cov_8.259762_1_plen_220_part_01